MTSRRTSTRHPIAAATLALLLRGPGRALGRRRAGGRVCRLLGAAVGPGVRRLAGGPPAPQPSATTGRGCASERDGDALRITLTRPRAVERTRRPDARRAGRGTRPGRGGPRASRASSCAGRARVLRGRRPRRVRHATGPGHARTSSGCSEASRATLRPARAKPTVTYVHGATDGIGHRAGRFHRHRGRGVPTPRSRSPRSAWGWCPAPAGRSACPAASGGCARPGSPSRAAIEPSTAATGAGRRVGSASTTLDASKRPPLERRREPSRCRTARLHGQRCPGSIIASHDRPDLVGLEVRGPLDPGAAPRRSGEDLDARLMVREAERTLDDGVDQASPRRRRSDNKTLACDRPGQEGDDAVVPIELRLDHEAGHEPFVAGRRNPARRPRQTGPARRHIDLLDD